MQIKQLKIKKRTVPEWFTLYLFIFPFVLSFFLEFLKLPSFVKYTADIAWVSLFAVLWLRRRIQLNKNIVVPTVFIGAWIFYVLTVYLFNYQSAFYFLWGIRNNFRFYIAFIAFANFMDEDDIDSCFKFIEYLFWINAVIAFFQFFVLGFRQDYLGGIFGTEKGCNAYNLIFFCVVLIRSMINYFNGKENAVLCILKCGIALIIAAMAEMKFFFVIFVLMFILAMFMTKFSWKKFIIGFFIALIVSFTGNLLSVIFGEGSALTFENIVRLATTGSYSSADDLGRFTAIPMISELFLHDLPDKLFGLGLGNCDTSAFAICNTPFFQTYEYLHYSWFSSAFLYLETGILGLLFNLGFYVVCMIGARKKLKNHESDPLLCKMTIIMAALCIILTFYNSALRKEVAYIAYFVLALPFLASKGTKDSDRINELQEK